MSVASWCCKSFCVVPCASFCTGHFVMVPLNMTYLHCLQHSLFEHLFNLYHIKIFKTYVNHVEDHHDYMYGTIKLKRQCFQRTEWNTERDQTNLTNFHDHNFATIIWQIQYLWNNLYGLHQMHASGVLTTCHLSDLSESKSSVLQWWRPLASTLLPQQLGTGTFLIFAQLQSEINKNDLSWQTVKYMISDFFLIFL